jgi:predicted DNA-binding transcriptional regulator AlpA
MKAKKIINDDLIDLEGVCNYFGLSESTIRRKIRDTSEGNGNFPLPLFGSKCRIVFRKADIESWHGEDSEIINFTPSLPPPNHYVEQNSAKIRKGLEAMGIKFPGQPSKESNK